MGQFKPMVKMMTTEPSVELKLKKGGSVHHKKGGHAKGGKAHKVEHHMDGGLGGLSGLGAPSIAARPVGLAARTAGRPTMAARRAAMNAPLMAKKGGKAEHKLEHLEHELKAHEKKPAHKGHHGLKKGGHCYADGGAVMDKVMTKTTIKGDEKKYLDTLMHDGESHDYVHGTGDVKEGKPGGFKKGGHIKHHAHGGKVHHVSGHPEGSAAHHKHMAKHHAEMYHSKGGSAHHAKMHMHHAHLAKVAKHADGGSTGRAIPSESISGSPNTTLVDTGRHDTAHGTRGVTEGQPGGFKHGGKIHAKKHFATGGSVNDTGRPVALPKKPVSSPVAITKLSGTFKKGGQVAALLKKK